MNPIIILGSSRSFGNTRKAIEQIIGKHEIPVIDLNSLQIKQFDYEYRNQDDDYLPLMEQVLQYDLIVLATPVYWYTMSAQMKIFIDRFSDLLDIRKDLGAKLRDKKLFVLASFGTSYPKGFANAFEQTCQYLGMDYQGISFIYHGKSNAELLAANHDELSRARAVILPPSF